MFVNGDNVAKNSIYNNKEEEVVNEAREEQETNAENEMEPNILKIEIENIIKHLKLKKARELTAFLQK